MSDPQPVADHLQVVVDRIKKKASNYDMEAEAERLLARYTERVEAKIRRIVPRRYWSAQCEDGALIRHLDDALGGRVDAQGLVLTGPTGRGKTHNLLGLVRRALERDPWMSVGYYALPRLLARLRPGGGANVGEELDRLCSVRLLVLDDLGAAKASEWVDEIMYVLIDTRYIEQRPTFFATNVKPADFSEAFGDRIAGRLRETCRVVALTGPDRRRSEAL